MEEEKDYTEEIRRLRAADVRLWLQSDEDIIRIIKEKERQAERQEAQKGIVGILETEFDLQLATLIESGYPEAAGVSAEKFLSAVSPLKKRIPEAAGILRNMWGDEAVSALVEERRAQSAQAMQKEEQVLPGKIRKVIKIPFLIVATKKMISIGAQMRCLTFQGRRGDPPDFDTSRGNPISMIRDLGDELAFLAVGVHLEPIVWLALPEFMKKIRQEGKLVFACEEGIALVTHYQEFLTKYRIVLLGSWRPRRQSYDDALMYENNDKVPVLCVQWDRPTVKELSIPERARTWRFAWCVKRLARSGEGG